MRQEAQRARLLCGAGGKCNHCGRKFVILLWYSNSVGNLSWRACNLWGLASGIGFGVSEGISYSADFYNGILAADIYVVRFVSCVALHAIWSASVGVFVFQQRERLR